MSIDSVVNLDDIKKIAYRASENDQSVEVINYRLEPYSKEKVGFLGNHQKLEITVKQKKSGDEPTKLNFFLKSLPRNSPEQCSFIEQQGVYAQEAEFFNELMRHFLEVTSVGNVEPWSPKCYLATNSVIVLEDVRTKGFSMPERKILEGVTLKAAVMAMARLHAASILTEKKLGKPLNELYPQACVEQIFKDITRKYGLKLPEELITDIAKKNGRVVDSVQETLESVFDYMQKKDKKHCVICHGDAWPNNIMLTSHDPPKCLLVDYQMVRYAPRMCDVAQLLYLSTTKDIRQKEEQEMIKAYWNELCETLMKCNPSIERPSLEGLQKEYEENRLVALVICIIYFPVVLLNKEVLRDYEHDPKAFYDKFVFKRSNDCVFEQMKKDENFSKRITETVIEFVENCKTRE